MDLTTLDDIGPWDWPSTTRQELKDALRDRTRTVDERSVAATHAGNIVVMDDEMAALLLEIVASRDEPDRLRARAAVALGPTLQQCDEDGFDESPYSEELVSEDTFSRICATLENVFNDTSNPSMVRRRALEAAVRAPADWHANAIRKAYWMKDGDWKQTAVFCMGYIPGFEQEITQALQSRHEDMQFEAIRAAGAAEIQSAWPLIRDILENPKTDKTTLLAAIEAAESLCPREDSDVIYELTESRDPEIAETAEEALTFINIDDSDFGDDDDFGAESDDEEDEEDEEDFEDDDLEDHETEDDEDEDDEDEEDDGGGEVEQDKSPDKGA
ncbi:MAG: hypothetical protein IT168_14260 [Bryobacterales bacterium]|nr:hypothetical protein [Bryobacterales bacterium]